MTKLLYRLTSLLVSMLGGTLARAIFKRAWQFAADEPEAPKSSDARRGWREVLLAAALQGAILAVVQAAADRAAAESTRKLTGTWPGDGNEEPQAACSP